MNNRFLLAGVALIVGLVLCRLDNDSVTPDIFNSSSTFDSQVHSHAGGEVCDDCQGGSVLRRTVRLNGEANWMDREAGEEAFLGFSIAGESRGRVMMREDFEDGRLAISIKLKNGYDLYFARNGTEWEGRAMPRNGGNAWKVRLEGETVTLEEMEIGAVICSWEVEDDVEVAGLPPVRGPLPVEESLAPAVAELEPPTLNSLPGANGVIYLDFDGETVSGTQWNSSYNDGDPIVAGPSGFSDAKIQTVWKRVSEDYSPFNVNVTTDRAVFDSYPINRRAMLVFTPDNEWYGSSGGVAYVDVFGSASFDAPGWVFVDQLANSSNYAAEAASHEAGHMFGLRHDGTTSVGYYEGHGSGATTWAPIMGVGYYSNVVQWSKGEYPDANNSEDDLAIISKSYNGLGYRSDEHSDSEASATPMIEIASDQLEGSGLIEQNTDLDYFSFQTSGGQVVIDASNSDDDPNLDIRLRLLDSSGSEVAVSDVDGILDASISATVVAGDYFVEVQGAGNGNLTSGYGDYGSLGAYVISGSAPRNTVLAANVVFPSLEAIVINEGAGLFLEGFVSGGSPAWELISAPAGGAVAFSSPASSSTEAVFSGVGAYTLRLTADSGSETISDELSVVVEPVNALSSNAMILNLGPDRTIFADRVLLDPEVSGGDSATVSRYRWSILSGNGQLSATDEAQPELQFSSAGQINIRLQVDYSNAKLFQEVSMTASFSEVELLAAGSTGATFSPDNGDLGNAWRQPSFDDSQWQSGLLGAGYEVLTGGNTSLYSALIGSGLDVRPTMYKKTAGCYIRSSFNVSDSSQMLSLTLHVCFDDGFVAYLNGVEVARSNVPAGSPSWNTLASTDRLDSAALTPTEYPITLSPGLLLDGTNVLAIHGMNSAVSTSEREFLLVPEITGVVALTPYSLTMGSVGDPSLTATTADADGDGRANLLEHGAGTSPTAADEPFTLVSLLDDRTAAVVLPEMPPEDVRYTLLHSMQMDGSWSIVTTRTGSGPWTDSPVIDVLPLGNGRERTCFSLSDGPRGFLRLKMELVAP